MTLWLPLKLLSSCVVLFVVAFFVAFFACLYFFLFLLVCFFCLLCTLNAVIDQSESSIRHSLWTKQWQHIEPISLQVPFSFSFNLLFHHQFACQLKVVYPIFFTVSAGWIREALRFLLSHPFPPQRTHAPHSNSHLAHVLCALWCVCLSFVAPLVLVYKCVLSPTFCWL